MIVYPNAKINIYLDIVGKRVDGYHELETLMIPVDIFDEMQIEFSDEDDVLCEGINKEENLVYKALKLFKEEYCIDKNFKISLKKIYLRKRVWVEVVVMLLLRLKLYVICATLIYRKKKKT